MLRRDVRPEATVDVHEPPTPPAEPPTDVVDALDDCSPELLRRVARYAEELAEYREREVRLVEADDEDEIEERPDDVPSTATITPKRSPTTATTGSGGMAIR